ncbi:hypothetical protein DPMN_018331, partial [Dreissena polymorpha]
MADEEIETLDANPNNTEIPFNDVFANGNNESEIKKECSDESDTFECMQSGIVLPRKSSFMSKDGSRRGHSRKKTVSFSSMPTERKIATAQDCLSYMQQGSELVKVRSNSRQYHRIFSLNSDMTEVRWQPTSKKPHKARIPVVSIKEVRSGKTTDALKNKEIAGIFPDECAFSIVFGDNFESMDLIANTPDEAHIWVTGLTCLINTNTRTSTCNTTTPEALEEMQQMRD